MNILRLAHNLIPEQVITLASFASRSLNNLGNFINTYTFSTINCKLSAPEDNIYRQFGLDYKRKHFVLHVIPEISGLTRVNSGDKFKFNDQFYQVESQIGWQPMADWDSYLSVQIPDDGIFP